MRQKIVFSASVEKNYIIFPFKTTKATPFREVSSVLKFFLRHDAFFAHFQNIHA
jgi:hypothetical protein